VVELALTQSLNSEIIDRCLFAAADTPKQATDICFETTRILARSIWTPSTREMLELLFTKLKDIPSKHRNLYSELHKSILSSQASQDILLPSEFDSPIRNESSHLVKQKFQDALLLVNGVPIHKAFFVRSHEVYQWMVITNWGQIFSRTSRWNEFKAELATAKAKSISSCEEVRPDNVWSGGLAHVQFYFSKDCKNPIHQHERIQEVANNPWPKTPVNKPATLSPWIPVIALLGVGFASSLRGKKVSVNGMKF
jgi:hypothetical protein